MKPHIPPRDHDDPEIRIDKWLWAIRIFKTRSQASDACRAGKVRLGETPVKPSREVRLNDTYTITMGPIQRTIRVKALLRNRMSAKLAVEAYEDITPVEEAEKLRLIRELRQGIRPRGLGRPTKKERRDLESFSGEQEED